jgi:Ca2+-binding RTX toxin-like protein
VTGQNTTHRGDDWAAQSGTDIPAAAGGQVVFSGWMRDYGNTLAVRHEISGEVYYSLYAHMLEAPTLKKDDWVLAGQRIGLTGSTGGRSTGPHLHFELLPGPRLSLLTGDTFAPPSEFDFADPLDYLQRPGSHSALPQISPAVHHHFAAARNAPPGHQDSTIHESNKLNKLNEFNKFDNFNNFETTAFLVLDRNGNGRIELSQERFGDTTPLDAGGTAADGFAALAQEDSNHDGQVDAADARWTDLRLWHDLNLDGLAQNDELSTLAEYGITTLNLGPSRPTPANGKPSTEIGSFLRSEAPLGMFGEVNILNAPDTPEALEPLEPLEPHAELTEAAHALPEMQGAGEVRDLRQAARLQTPAGLALAATLAAFATARTRSEQMHQLDGLLKAWAETSTMATTASGAFAGVDLSLNFTGVPPDSPAWQAWMDKLSILERFNGRTFLPLPAAGTTLAMDVDNTRQRLLDAAYTALKDSVYDGLVLQTRLNPCFDAVSLHIDADGIRLDFSGLEAALDARHARDPVNALVDRIELLRYGGTSLQDAGWKGLSTLHLRIAEAEREGRWKTVRSLLGWAYRRAATAGDDFHLMGSAAGVFGSGQGDDVVLAGRGSNLIFSDAGHDRLDSGGGNDTLYAGAGNDTLAGGTGSDTLFGGRGNDSYVFSKGDGVDAITDGYDRWYGPGGGVADTVRFLDVKSTEVSALRAGRALLLNYGTSDQLAISGQFDGRGGAIERLVFSDSVSWDQAWIHANLTLRGTAGNDTLYGLAIDDQIYGLDGNDLLKGNAGHDLLVAGAGDDTLYGGAGDDILDGCMGMNIMHGGAGNDTLYGGTDDDIVYGGPGRDRLHGDDGIDIMYGDNGNDILYGDAGNDIMFGGAGRDRLHGDAGYDILFGGAGRDSLHGATGKDSLSNTSGTAILDAGRDNDTLTGGGGAELFLGGQGNDIYTTGSGHDLILFNKGDGQDILAADDTDVTGSDTLSLGGDFAYSDLSLSRADQDLVQHMGDSDQLSFQDWYAARPSRLVVNLQVITEAMSDFNAGGSDPLRDQKVERFDFSGLVNAFDAARSAAPALQAWSLCAALLDVQLAGSDFAAVGGELAYQYGKNGSMRALTVSTLHDLIDDRRFGSEPQALQPLDAGLAGTRAQV